MHRAVLAGVLRVSAPCRMRFDSHDEQHEQQQQQATATATATATASSRNSNHHDDKQRTRRASVSYRALPESMMPRQVPADFTPYPLPKYDRDMGYGPVRLRNVPDIAAAEQRQAQAQRQETPSPPSSPSPPSPVDAAEWLYAELAGQQTLPSHTLGTPQPVAAAAAAPRGRVTAVDVAVTGGVDDAAVSTLTAGEQVSSSSGEDVRAAAAAAAAAVTATAQTVPPVAHEDADALDADALTGYHVGPHYPLIDRLECHRSVDDLLRQFVQRPYREARVATVLDVAAIVPRCSDDELTRALHELSGVFTPEGNGANFVVLRQVQYGRPFAVVSALKDAYVHLVHALTDTLVTQQPARLRRAPGLFVQLLHFLALLKVFTPNVWYAGYSNTPQNRADYRHACGVNKHTAHQCVGEVLYDHMVQCICADEDNVDDGGDDGNGEEDATTTTTAAAMRLSGHGRSALLRRCDEATLVSMLGGFAACSPDCLPRGDVANAIVHTLRQRWAAHDNVLHTAHDVALLEQVYLTLQLLHYPCEDIRDALLWPLPPPPLSSSLPGNRTDNNNDDDDHHHHDDGDARHRHAAEAARRRGQRGAAGHRRPLCVALAPQCGDADAWQCRGADFFAAVSRERDAAVRQRALELLHTSLQHAHRRAAAATATATATDAHAATTLLQALCEAGNELLQTLDDTTVAARVACQYDMDAVTLQAMPSMQLVAQRLRAQSCSRDGDRYVNDSTVRAGDVQATLMQRNVQQTRQHTRNDNDNDDNNNNNNNNNGDGDGHATDTALAAATRQPRVRTLLASLPYLNGCDMVFLLHSSALRAHADELVSAVRRMRNGKDALVVSTACLRALTAQTRCAADAQARQAAHRALEVLAYELERGRVVLVPVSDELRVHDAGVYCDEDLLFWTLAAFFARELPLVKTHAMVHRTSRASRPYVYLKGPHSPLKSSRDVYRPDAPLLSGLHGKELYAVTARARLRSRVRDRATTLYCVSTPHARRVYRRDKAMFDKFHTTARHLAPGFSVGALASDQRGLGYYTPDHAQVPYSRVPLAAHVLPVTPST